MCNSLMSQYLCVLIESNGAKATTGSNHSLRWRVAELTRYLVSCYTINIILIAFGKVLQKTLSRKQLTIKIFTIGLVYPATSFYRA
uniref:Uncharacterized protein n=1 Tax=Pararge aegeria TaxID=116150 RepID=S4PHY5_9NEOP